MRKRFVLDTNVLLHDPSALEGFADEEVLVPIYAIEEIDQFKRELSERGRNARIVSRRLDGLRSGGGNLADGVQTEGGGRLRVVFIDGTRTTGLPSSRPQGTPDELILSVALQEQRREPQVPLIFVTRDVNLRIRADALGLQAVDFLDERVDISELYSGVTELEVDAATVDKLYAEGHLPHEGLYPNQFVLLKDRSNTAHGALARFDDAAQMLCSVSVPKQGVWGIHPRNKEQRYAFDLLLHDEIKLVTLVGKAGTGKTLLAIAAGLQKVVEESSYKKLLVSRPIFPLGKDIGFLPGDVEAKLNPWMQPIYDNLELLLGAGHKGRREQDYREFLEMGRMEVEPLTYIRGRSIPHQFMIVDEAQNLTPHEVKTIVTRAGEQTKLIFTGDPYQIDNPYVDSSNNGLSTLVERFKGERLAGHITLVKGERSALAELAANVL